MGKRNFNRSAGNSLCPRTSRLSESERQEMIMGQMGKGKYYAAKGRANRETVTGHQPERDLSVNDLELARQHRLKVKKKIERLEMMLARKELDLL
jgi:hypothetical protein